MMKKTFTRYFFVVFLLCYPFHSALGLKFDRIDQEQGLTSTDILSIVQDHQGFMWFGTKNGLFRYDGYGMKAFKHDPQDSTSLGNNNVFAILEDNRGNLWIGTAGGGLNLLNRKNEQFRRFKHDPSDPNSLSADVVSVLYQDKKDFIWAGTWTGLNKIDPIRKQIDPYINDPENPQSMNPHWIRSISEDSAGNIWVGTDGGIARLELKSGTFNHFKEDNNNPNSLASNTVNAIIKDHDGIMWIGSGAGLEYYDDKKNKFVNLPTGITVISIFQDSDGKLWIGTYNGLLRYDKINKKFIRYLHDSTDPFSLSDNTVRCIYEDQTGVLWIGTSNGINRLDNGQYRFKKIVPDANDINNFSYNTTTAIHSANDKILWISKAQTTGSGLQVELEKFNLKTGDIEQIYNGMDDAPILRRLWINQIYQDRSEILWIGTPAGLGRYNPRTKKFTLIKHDPQNPNSLSSNNISLIYEDQIGRLWIANNKDGSTSIDIFDRKTNQFKCIPLGSGVSSGRNQRNGVHSISEGTSGRLWFATMGDGVFCLNPGSDQFVQYTHEPKNLNSLSHNWVGVAHEDRNGIVWAAPWYGGLNKLDPESGMVTIYTEKEGLASNYITSIVEDDQGFLWLSTKNGLSRFDPYNKKFKNFDRYDGLLNDSYEFWNASAKSKNGDLFFAGGNGIDYVSPDSIRDNSYIPPVVFTGFTRYNIDKTNGKVVIEKGISKKKRLDLNYKDLSLNFEFAALNYRAPHKNQYMYKLEGFSENWINLGKKHDITFTNLDPGEYILHVKGSNNDGIWNEKGASLVINISPPWWQTGWAYTIYLLLIGLTLYGVRKFELKHVHLRTELEKQSFQAQKLQEVDQLKSRFFANISHEFRTPLTLILGPLQKFLSGTEEKDKHKDLRVMQRNAFRLNKLIDQLLDLSKIEAMQMPLQASQQNIVPKLKEWAASFVSLAESKNIAFELKLPTEALILYFDVEKMEKVFFNLLSNAFKFTPETGRICVEVKYLHPPQSLLVQEEVDDSSHPNGGSEGCFILFISDTGPGITPEHLKHIFDRFYSTNNSTMGEQSSTGIGLALVKEFINLHHGDIEVKSEPGKGSTFTVSLPLGRKHLSDEEIIDWDDEKRKLRVKDSNQQSVFSEKQIMNDQQSTSSVSVPNLSSTASKNLILIVEDNPDMRQYLHNCLNKNLNIIETYNGVDGYNSAIENIPDLVLSDVMMPEMDGFELCNRLKTDARTSHIPVILLTARASKESRVEGLQTGADDYLVKPFDADELTIRVNNLIVQRQKLRRLFRQEITIQPKEITVTSIDEKLLQRAIDIVETNISNNKFQIEQFCAEMAMSRSTLNRKLRALTGLSSNEFIRLLRLKRAAQLLQKNSATIAEIAYQVGFNNPSYFAESFRAQFGKSPSEYI